MKLIHRIGYYLGGFSIGLIILAFFFNGKKTSCSYGPNARVLKNIRLKTIVYSSQSQSQINANNLDTVAINYVLKKGDVDFTKSNARQEPCGVYVVEGSYNEQDILLTIENCDSIATITDVELDIDN
ncbi:MAG: hypothetical protein ACK5MZ_08335 [Aestuariibaculum sp.]